MADATTNKRDRDTNRNARKFHILAAGPVVNESGMMPVRIVLRRKDGGFVTHKQAVAGKLDHLHASFASGNYFMNCDGGPTVALEKATADFCRRLQEQLAGKTECDLSLMTGCV